LWTLFETYSTACAKLVEENAMNESVLIGQHEFDSLQIDKVSSDEIKRLSETMDGLNVRKRSYDSHRDDDITVLVRLEPPYRFRDTSELFLKHFRFKRQDVIDKTIRVLFGPETDQRAVCSLISGRCGSPKIPLILYRKDGEEIRCTAWSLLTTEEDASVIAFNVDIKQHAESTVPCATFLGEQQPISFISSQQKGRSTAADPTASATLLSDGIAFNRAVAIHLRVIRRAGAATAARRLSQGGESVGAAVNDGA
jgi:hypothetical protein